MSGFGGSIRGSTAILHTPVAAVVPSPTTDGFVRVAVKEGLRIEPVALQMSNGAAKALHEELGRFLNEGITSPVFPENTKVISTHGWSLGR